MTTPIVTALEHMQGFKELAVLLRDGSERDIRLTAPNRKMARDLALAIREAGGLEPVVQCCLPVELRAKEGERSFMDRLSMESAAEVEMVSCVLTYGEDWYQKKMVPIQEAFRTVLESGDAKSFASALEFLGKNSGAGPIPSSRSASS